VIFERRCEFGAPRHKRWDFLVDPVRMAECVSEVKSFEVEGEDKFVTVVRVGVGYVKTDFKFKAEITGKEPLNRVHFQAAGSGSGSNIVISAFSRVFGRLYEPRLLRDRSFEPGSELAVYCEFMETKLRGLCRRNQLRQVCSAVFKSTS